MLPTVRGMLSVARASRRNFESAYLHVRDLSNIPAGGQESSEDTASSSGRDGDVRERLLEASLKHVKQQGWTHASLVAAARDLQLSPAVTGILLRREAELVEHAIHSWNQQLSTKLQERAHELHDMPEVRQKLAFALRLRLEMLQPYMDTWPQALSVATQPSNLPHSLKLLVALMDDIWHAVGDKATNSTWYSKRGLLAAVYTSTELYMLTDYSPGFSETWQALDRRLADMVAAGEAAEDMVGMQGKAAGSFTAAAQHMGPPPV